MRRFPSLLLIALGAAMASPAEAADTAPHAEMKAPCAIMDRFEGEVQVLDATRTRLVETSLKTAVPCGGWISVRGGRAELRHRQGYDLRFAPDTFAEIFDNRGNLELTGEDHVVLYRGKIYVDVPKGGHPLRVLTANGRIRVQHGEAVVIYSGAEEETQVISLRNEASLENRFADSRPVMAREGEATSLNFRIKRVVPETPAAVSVSVIKSLLADFPIDERTFRDAVAVVQKRVNRLFAEERGAGRKPASSGAKRGPYARHPGAGGPGARWYSRLVGDGALADELLQPGKSTVGRKPASVAAEVIVEDPVAAYDRRKKREEDEEKQRLIRALSGIRTD